MQTLINWLASLMPRHDYIARVDGKSYGLSVRAMTARAAQRKADAQLARILSTHTGAR